MDNPDTKYRFAPLNDTWYRKGTSRISQPCRKLARLSPFVVAILVIVSCSGSGRSADENPEILPKVGASAKFTVVTTGRILADLVSNIGGRAVTVRSVVPPDADVHTFRLAPQDAQLISSATLVISNGGHIDDWINPALETIGPQARHVIASTGLELRSGRKGEGGQQENAEPDPHFWLDPSKVVVYVENIRNGLTEIDPLRTALYAKNASTYVGKLNALDHDIRERLAHIPPNKRILITFHDAFGHFGDRYNFRVLAFTGKEGGAVNPQSVVDIANVVKDQSVQAMFAEPQFQEDVVNQLATDTQVSVAPIYSDSTDHRVSTYIDLMQFNANSIANHLL